MLNMLIHDKSFGSTPKFPNIQNSYPVDCGTEKAATPIEHIWNWAAECSRINGGINNLLIACHGGYLMQCNKARENEGGFGIKLGTGINLLNVHLTKALAGRVKNIFFYVCGAARTPDYNLAAPDEKDELAKSYNNRLMMMRMADYTRCNIYAPTDEQRKIIYSKKREGFDFGAWEGTVEKFVYIDRGKGKGGIVSVNNVTLMMHNFGEED